MRRILRYIGLFILLLKRGWQRLVWGNIQKSMMAECGRNVKLANGCDLTYSNLHVGNDVYLGPFTYVISPFAHVYIGNHVMFGPNVMIISSDHKFDVVGKNMRDVAEESGSDKDVIIEDDVWIGANTIILKGVTIGKGSVIGAGSIVTKNIEPYTIYVGAPNKKYWERFDSETIIKHEKIITSNSI
jgi:acetyltransferase-like isoleucine patch superfamily enzyme